TGRGWCRPSLRSSDDAQWTAPAFLYPCRIQGIPKQAGNSNRKSVLAPGENPYAEPCICGRPTVCSGGVTHDQLRAVLPPYAAGELDEGPAEVVRAHLATGCPDCLGALFRLPVGRPRSRWEAGLRRERRLAPATAVVLALALAALVGWTIRDLRQREAERRAESVRAAARLIEVEIARAEAVARSDAFGRTLEAVRGEVAEARAAARGAAGERARLEAELAAAEAGSGSVV